jgi:hypothetical protein
MSHPFDIATRQNKTVKINLNLNKLKGILISTCSTFYQSYIFFELNNAPLGLVEEMLGIIDAAFWNAQVSPSRNG